MGVRLWLGDPASSSLGRRPRGGAAGSLTARGPSTVSAAATPCHSPLDSTEGLWTLRVCPGTRGFFVLCVRVCFTGTVIRCEGPSPCGFDLHFPGEE